MPYRLLSLVALVLEFERPFIAASHPNPEKEKGLLEKAGLAAPTQEITMNRKLLLKIQDIFHAKLQAKTGWGRNEIMDLYRDSVNEALIEMMDEADDKP